MLAVVQSMRLKARVLTGFALVMSLLLAGSALGIWRIQQLNDRIDRLVNVDMEALDLARSWAGLTESNIQRRIITIWSDDADFVKAFTAKSKEVSARVDKIQDALGDLPKSAESERIKAQIDQARKRYQELRDDIGKQKAAGTDVRARVVGELIPAMEAYLEPIHGYAEQSRKELQQARDVAEDQARSAFRLITGLLIGAAACGVWIALSITRSITAPLDQARDMAARIAEGDLSQAVVVQGRDELAELAESLDQMRAQLGATIADVRHVAEQVQMASSEIASGNMDLSNRTEQAASSLEQTGAAMMQLREGVQANAQAARQADELAKSAAAVADRGGAMVQQVVDTMTDIQQSSARIADITNVIDSIAFQTNILALNAAVEAARAGEQGRGFAVVASEVRALAQRCAQAAREIKSLIGASAEKVEAGGKLVSATGATIADAVQSVQRVTHIVAEISSATSAQASTLGEIGQAVGHLDQMTQQNASLVEESAAAAEGLKQQAQTLVSHMAKFRLAAARRGE